MWVIWKARAASGAVTASLSPVTKVLQAAECRLPGLVYFDWSSGFVIRLLLDLANLLCFLSLHFLCAKIEERGVLITTIRLVGFCEESVHSQCAGLYKTLSAITCSSLSVSAVDSVSFLLAHSSVPQGDFMLIICCS